MSRVPERAIAERLTSAEENIAVHEKVINSDVLPGCRLLAERLNRIEHELGIAVDEQEAQKMDEARAFLRDRVERESGRWPSGSLPCAGDGQHDDRLARPR